MKKSGNLLLFFIRMAFISTFILFLSMLIPIILTQSLYTSKYGAEAIGELIMALIVFIVLLRYGNGYIFTEKGEKLRNSLFIAGPFLFIAVLNFLLNVPAVVDAPIGNVVNVIIYCFAIGIFEEFLCRGWVQNEFIERFGDSRKGVVLSILCASLIFGAFHFTNLIDGQPLLETTLQVLQATSVGFLLGAIFFRTKNIWTVVLLHGFYDLAIFIGEVNLYKDCTTIANPGMEAMIIQYVISIVLVIIFTLTAFYILRKEKTDHLIEQQFKEPTQKEKKTNQIIKYTIIGLMALLFVPIPKDVGDLEKCYNYKEIKYEDNYEIHLSYYDKYIIEKDVDGILYELEFYKDNDDTLYLTNRISKYKVKLASDIETFKVIKNNDYYVLMFKGLRDVYYLKENYSDINNTNSYLDEYKDRITKLEVPDTKEMGYLTTDTNKEKIPMIRTDLNDIFVIESIDDIKVVK